MPIIISASSPLASTMSGAWRSFSFHFLRLCSWRWVIHYFACQKSKRDRGKAYGLTGCWSVLEMSSRLWAGFLLCILADASGMITPTFGSDCKARAAPLNENQVAVLQSAPLEKLVCLSVLQWISVCLCWMLVQNFQIGALHLTLFCLQPKPDVNLGCLHYLRLSCYQHNCTEYSSICC